MLEDTKEVVREPATYWFYQVPKGFDDAGREIGPLSMTALEQLWPEGSINGETLMHTKDDWQWRPLKSIRCLRWRFMMAGQSRFTPVEVALACVDIMLMLCGMFPTTDEYGTMMKPLPRARVLLSDVKKVLPHLVQLFVTQQPKLIEKASILIKMIAVENSELVRKLYRTGLFCFAFMYQGSNVLPLVELVKATHAEQQFQGFEDALMMTEKDVVKKSILSTIFPDSLVIYLHNRSPYDFVKTYLGEHDTPELIWTQSMRDVLMKELAQHTSDFAWQLREFPMSVYDYEPVPSIAFKELTEEVWLHTCYLKNLADGRFPMWQIDEPVEFLRALLTHWGTLLKGDPEALNDSASYKLLGCEPDAEPAQLKKAYRKLAIKYHPDKNPDGHEMFQSITKAYEHLTRNKGVGEQRNQAHGIKLILNAHVVLYKQHYELLGAYKYAGYPLLLEALKGMNAGSEDVLSGDGAAQLEAGLTTLLLTIKSSPKNGEEFCRMKGIYVLEVLLGRCAEVLTVNTHRDDHVFALTTCIVRVFSLLLQDQEFLDNSDLYHNMAFMPKDLGANNLVRDIINCLKFTQSPVLTRHTIACVSAMCNRSDVQQEMMIQGTLWLLLPTLFWFDEEESKSDDYHYEMYDASDTRRDYSSPTEIQTRDAVAREAAIALMRFVGWGSDEHATALCPLVQDSILGVLGPGLANLLKGMADPTSFLKTINSHNEKPELVWYEAHIGELCALCRQQIDDLAEGVCDHEVGVRFEYKVTENELCVHGIFVRVLVKRTMAEGYHEDVALPEIFFQRLLQWCVDPSSLPAALDHPTRGEKIAANVVLSLQCILNMIAAKKDRTAFISDADSTHQLFEFCAPDIWPDAVHTLTLDIIARSGKEPKLIQDIIRDASCLTPLLCVLKTDTNAAQKGAINALQVLTDNPKILVECIRRGCIIYLLAIASTLDAINVQARAVLAKMSKSALHGLKVTDAMEQFLPKAVVNGIVNELGEDEFTFTMECKTPELIWNDQMAMQFRQAVSDQLEQLYTSQVADWKAKPELDEMFGVDYEVLEDEMYVGGIYVRLFLKNPQYNIRKPEKFVEALFAAHEALACAEGMAKDLGYICTCIITVLKVRVPLCDHLANLGIVERLLNRMWRAKTHGRKATLKYFHMLASSSIACEKFSRNSEGVKVFRDLVEDQKDRKDVLDVLTKLLDGAKPSVRTEVVMQLEEAGYIPLLFTFLKNKEEPVPLKVAGVELLKAMARDDDEATSAAVTQQLEQYPEWREYKDANHDLFIQTGNDILLLEGGNAETLLLEM
eukprot:SAG11_NODE_4_length_33019_cov_28.098909_27_plen_1292_part_00